MRGEGDAEGPHAISISSRHPQRSSTDDRRHDDERNRAELVHQLGMPEAAQAASECGTQGEPRGSDRNDLNSHHGDPWRQFDKADRGRQEQECKIAALGLSNVVSSTARNVTGVASASSRTR
jgi:hypothetical protein